VARHLALILWLGGLLGFAVVAAFAAAHDTFPGDILLTHRLQEIDGSAFARLLDWTEDFADFPLLIAVWGAGSLALLFLAGRWDALLMLASLAGRLPNTVLKEITERPRPSADLVDVNCRPTSLSFPSGHAEGALILYGLIFYFAALYLPNPWVRLPLQTVCVWIVLVTGIERVDAGCHWPSDVLGGFYFGFLILVAVIVVHRLVISPRKE